jgi:hypothetical protein
MAHWLPGDELGVRTEVAPLSSRQLARVPAWTRQVHDRLLGMRLDGLAPHPHRPDPRPRPVPRHRPRHRPPRPPPAPQPRNHPRPRPPTMTVPRSPDGAGTSSPAGPPPSSPTDKPSAHTLAGAPAGHLPTVPRAPPREIRHHAPGHAAGRWTGCSSLPTALPPPPAPEPAAGAIETVGLLSQTRQRDALDRIGPSDANTPRSQGGAPWTRI